MARVARVELAHHAGRGVARVDEGLLVLRAAFDQLALALVQRLEVVAAHEDLAAHLEHRARCTPFSRFGTAAMVRTVCVTSSPVSPSPRVAACTSTPRFVAQVDRQAVELQLGRVVDRRVGLAQAERACARARRTSRRRRRVVSVSVSIDSIGTTWRTGCRPSSTAPITRCVGESGVTQLGMRGLDRLQLLEQPVVLGIGNLRLVEHVVALA